MSLDSASNIYNGCSLKQKTICKEHYLEAAAPLLSRMVSTTDNIPFDTNLNTLHMKEEMVSEEVVADLNEKMVLLEVEEKLTAESVTLFLNDTIAYCVEKKRDRRGEKRVGTTGELKSVKVPKTELSCAPSESDSAASSRLEESTTTTPGSSSAADAANDTEEIVVDDEMPHSSKDVVDVESLLFLSRPVRRDTRDRKPPPCTPITKWSLDVHKCVSFHA
ncbi:hypothetical protein TELCIR_15731 [Teladorsagia circumcincta]|uniref:Uncharacterized protein n=1 Tax=Teladorsagia circumcincta TaxID=45464 RepID=A0A2G9TXF3_TELCI|nr:hypothetical protein TELCIR_15731 [Teladorsagia circumcincta]